jgi:threonine aldolase
MVVFRLADGAPDAATLAMRARAAGVMMAPFAVRTVRIATHLNVNRAHCERAADIVAALIEQG